MPSHIFRGFNHQQQNRLCNLRDEYGVRNRNNPHHSPRTFGHGSRDVEAVVEGAAVVDVTRAKAKAVEAIITTGIIITSMVVGIVIMRSTR